MKPLLLPLLFAASCAQASPLDDVICPGSGYRYSQEVVAQARHAVEAATANPGAERLLLADALDRLSDVDAGVSDNENASKASGEAYAIWSSATPATGLAEKMHASGTASLARGHCAAAQPLLQAALEMSEKLNGADDAHTLGILHDRVRVAVALKDAGAADAMAPRLLAAWDKAGAPAAADRLALYRNLALLYVKSEQYAKAEPLAQRGLGLAQATWPADPVHVRQMRALLAGAYYGQLRYAEAEAAFPRQAPRYDPKTAAHKSVEAEMIAKTRAGDLRGALQLGEKMLADDRAEFDGSFTTGARLAETLDIVGELHHGLNELAPAEPMYAEALALFPAHSPFYPPTHTRTQADLAMLYRARGEPARALPLQQEALKTMLPQLGPDHPDVLESEGELARIHKALENYAEAEPLYQRRLERAERTHAPPDEAAESLDALADIALAQGDRDRAAGYLRRAIALWQAAAPAGKAQLAAARARLAKLFAATAPQEPAKAAGKRAAPKPRAKRS